MEDKKHTIGVAIPSTTDMQFKLIDAKNALQHAAESATPEVAKVYRQRAMEVAEIVSALARGVTAVPERLPFDQWPQLAKDAYEALERHLEQGPSFPIGLLIQLRVGIAGRAVERNAGVPEAVRAAPPSVAASNTERVVFRCDNPGGCRFPKQPCLASCSLTANFAPTSGVPETGSKTKS